jgi:cytoskeleton protein RodZ
VSLDSTLGAYLRQCRQRSGASVETVSSGSRIVPQFIRALEADRHDLLPAPVYVRGFIRAYCEQVGGDAEEALRRYEARPGAAAAPRPAPSPPPAPAPWALARRWRPAVAGAALLVTLGLGATFFVGRARQPDAVAHRGPAMPASAPSAPAPAPVAGAPVPPDAARLPAAAAAPSAPATQATAGAPAPSPPAPAPAPPAAGLRTRVLLMRALDTTWVRVAPDGAPATEETLSAGAVREWRSAGRFRVTVGNAGGVEVELDGHPVPALGQRGQVVHRLIPDEPRP